MSRLLIPNGSARPLGEGDKIEILHYRTNGFGPVEIGARVHRIESTIRSFLKSYEKSRAIFLAEADLLSPYPGFFD